VTVENTLNGDYGKGVNLRMGNTLNGALEVEAEMVLSMNIRSSSEMVLWFIGLSEDRNIQTTNQSMPNTPVKHVVKIHSKTLV